MSGLSHADIVNIGAKWLIKNKRCSIVSTEMVSTGTETPDVIGWYGIFSYLLEAKISVSDFLADQKKFPRMFTEHGVGWNRYYIVPDVISFKINQMLPEKWGLLSTDGVHVKVMRKSEIFERNYSYELGHMISIVRRISGRSEPITGVNVKFYTINSTDNPRSSLYVEPMECEYDTIRT